MAIKGIGKEYDLSGDIANNLKTTTSQYRCVSLSGNTAGSDWTFDAARTGTSDFTDAAMSVIGVNQTYLSSGAETACIRVFGVGKCICAESIAAGSWVAGYYGVSTATMWGKIIQLDNGASGCSGYTGSAAGTQSNHITVVGRALENGSTNSVVAVMINPQLYDMSLVGSIGIT